MKLYAILVLAISMAISSCGEKKQHTTISETQDTPEALQDHKMDLKSYSRSSGDLTQELYAELVEQDPSLKQLEEDLDAYRSRPGELTKLFENYDGKSLNYYTSANRTADMISDSVLKQKMTVLITQSNERYLKKTNNINELLKQLSVNNTSLNDHHTALKIALTISVIEKYQSDNTINENQFKGLIKEQEKLLKQTDKLIPIF